jgi:hypothetical protein
VTTQTQTGFTRGPPGAVVGAARTSSFATTALRLTQDRESLEKPLPGPGEYSSSVKDAMRATRPVPKHQQFFGSTARRSGDVDQTKLSSAPSHLRSPGPGAYNCSSTFGHQPLADPACSAFNSTQVRVPLALLTPFTLLCFGCARDTPLTLLCLGCSWRCPSSCCVRHACLAATCMTQQSACMLGTDAECAWTCASTHAECVRWYAVVDAECAWCCAS